MSLRVRAVLASADSGSVLASMAQAYTLDWPAGQDFESDGVGLPRLKDHYGRCRFGLDVGLERLGVGLDRWERVVVHRDHGRRPDQPGGQGAVLAVHRVVAADRD